MGGKSFSRGEGGCPPCPPKRNPGELQNYVGFHDRAKYVDVTELCIAELNICDRAWEKDHF